MEYGEAWLLETLAIFRLPVGYMKRLELPMNEWLNRGYHRLSDEALVSTLAEMFRRGDIDAFYDNEMLKPAGLNDFLEALDDRNSTVHCGVSRAGGERWEALARPEWSRYFEDVGWDGKSVEITAGSQERIVEIVSHADILWRCTMSLNKDSVQPVTPWEPFPWKTLPVGYTATVRYVEVPFVDRPKEEVKEEHRRIWPRYVKLRSWASSICGHAYV
jgi:hypothetical protein